MYTKKSCHCGSCQPCCGGHDRRAPESPQLVGSCNEFDDPRQLWEDKVCLTAVSKDLDGMLCYTEYTEEECADGCLTTKSDLFLRLSVQAHNCDVEPADRLDGVIVIRRFVHILADQNNHQRGLHTGEFAWVAGSTRVEGTVSGLTNVGTHRGPAFDECQECNSLGYMEGRLCGVIVSAEERELIGCKVVAAYRFMFDPPELADAEVHGSLEGVLVCPCDRRESS